MRRLIELIRVRAQMSIFAPAFSNIDFFIDKFWLKAITVVENSTTGDIFSEKKPHLRN